MIYVAAVIDNINSGVHDVEYDVEKAGKMVWFENLLSSINGFVIFVSLIAVLNFCQFKAKGCTREMYH